MGQGWAKDILAADQQEITNAKDLHPANSRNNLYGALSLGMAPARGFESSDPTVKSTLKGWLTNLSKQFGPLKSYTPESLQQRAVDLAAAGDCIAKNTTTLAAAGELTTNDTKYLNKLAAALKSHAAAAKKLHRAVCAGPDIKSVELNIPARNH